MNPVSHIIFKMFKAVLCVIVNIFWNICENPYFSFTVKFLTDTPPRLDGRLWNSLIRREAVKVIISCSWKIHKNPFTRFSIILLTNTGQGNRKKSILDSRVNCNILKMFQIVPVLMPSLCWKCHENPFNLFLVMLLTETDFPEYIKMKSCIQWFERNNPQIFQLIPCVMPDLSWKFHEHPFIRFYAMLLTVRQPNKHNLHRLAEVKTSTCVYSFWHAEMFSRNSHQYQGHLRVTEKCILPCVCGFNCLSDHMFQVNRKRDWLSEA